MNFIYSKFIFKYNLYQIKKKKITDGKLFLSKTSEFFYDFLISISIIWFCYYYKGVGEKWSF